MMRSLRIFCVCLAISLNASCQILKQVSDGLTTTCEVSKTSAIDAFEIGTSQGDITLLVHVDNMVLTNVRGRVRIFVNSTKADADTPITDDYYLGSFSNFPTENTEMDHIFNFTSFLDRFPKSQAQSIIANDLYLTFVPVSLDNDGPLKFKTIKTACVLDIIN
ncbi:MAG: hypothetical protein DI538_06820 [Azospira oryzae]|nr:MAG: hypothetical protein DI538_06820 [Azospira oryzae]